MQSDVISKIEALAVDNYEVRKLWAEHLELDRQIDRLKSQPYLTPEQTTAISEMQKKKLLGKDKLFELLRLAKVG